MQDEGCSNVYRGKTAFGIVYCLLRLMAEMALSTSAGVVSSCRRWRGITAYLERGGTLENAQAMAAHESPRTTKLYDRTGEMLWIGGDLTQRLRPRSEQDIVDNGLVLEGDDLDLLGHREHDVEVGHVDQFGLTVREPLGARETLALWATFIAARVVRDALMATIAARLDVTAKSGGAAKGNSRFGRTIGRWSRTTASEPAPAIF